MLGKVVQWVNVDLNADLLTSTVENMDLDMQCWSLACLHTTEVQYR